MAKHRIYKTGKSTVIFFIVISFFFAFSISAKGDGINFYVSAVIPENQIDKNVSYFDLSVAPKQEQTLQVQVVNEGEKDLIVDVSAISASTNRNGIIDYETPDIKDKTLLYPFSEVATVRDETLAIPANSIGTAYVDITLPDEVFDGVVLGGIVITKDADANSEETASGENSVTIKNNYSYVIGVKLTETDTEITPNFELIRVEPELIDYRAAIAHYLRNTEPYIVKEMNIDLTITSVKSNEQYLKDSKTIDMAPNSVFQLTAYPESESLEPGKYNSKIVATLGEDEWVFEQEFTIERAAAKEVNDEVPKNTYLNPLYNVIILVLVIVILFLFILLLHKRKKDEDKENSSK